MGDTFNIPDPDDFECIKRVFSCKRHEDKPLKNYGSFNAGNLLGNDANGDDDSAEQRD